MRVIHVEVSDLFYAMIAEAAKANSNNSVEEWVRSACEESIEYDQRRDREREQRQHSGKVYTSGGPRGRDPQWDKAVEP